VTIALSWVPSSRRQALRENREVLEKLASIQNVTLSSHIDAALAAESPPK